MAARHATRVALMILLSHRARVKHVLSIIHRCVDCYIVLVPRLERAMSFIVL